MNRILDFSIINKKPDVTDGNGNQIVDLTKSVISYRSRLVVDTVIRVTKEYNGNPNLISKVYYGTEDYTDLLCFFNGISNPFSLSEGDILFIPTVESMANSLVDLSSQEPISKSLERSLPQADINRIKALNRGSVGIKPTNVVPEGTSNVEFEDGSIILGANSTNDRCSATVGAQTRAKAIRQSVIAKARGTNNS